MELDKLLLALAQGKKVRCKSWNESHFICLRDNQIKWQDRIKFVVDEHLFSYPEEFELYIEKVPFMTALQAFKEGKGIRRIDSDFVYQSISGYLFSLKDIESEWYILD